MERNFQSKNQAFNLAPGTRWLGKWNRNPYRVVKKLGKGANGTVFLVDTRSGQAAVKIGENKMSLTSEVNVLKHFSKVRGNVLGPSLLDVDDIEINGEVYPFFCMEYLKGLPLLEYTRKKGLEWAPVLMVQLLGDLDRLHQEGWTFGDLKPENIIVTGPPTRVRWFDVGGTTKMGRSIKEYTEFYDRGYWGLGDRKAEPTYDLFACAMIFIQTAYPKRFEKPIGKSSGLDVLERKISGHPALLPYKKVLLHALKGKYTEAQLMKKDVMEAIEKRSPSKERAERTYRSSKRKRQTSPQQNPLPKTKKRTEKKPSYRVEIILTASFLFLSSVLYFMGQWM